MDRLTEPMLEELLGRCLSEELDEQLGRAGAAFRQVQAREACGKRRRRFALGVASALAASLAVGWTVQSLFRQSTPLAQPEVLSSNDAARSLQPIEIQRSLAWHTLDEGTVLDERDKPYRKLRRQIIQRVRWYDPHQRAIVETIEPTEQVFLIETRRY